LTGAAWIRANEIRRLLIPGAGGLARIPLSRSPRVREPSTLLYALVPRTLAPRRATNGRTRDDILGWLPSAPLPDERPPRARQGGPLCWSMLPGRRQSPEHPGRARSCCRFRGIADVAGPTLGWPRERMTQAVSHNQDPSRTLFKSASPLELVGVVVCLVPP
jgi:hypothetical protein